MYTGAPFQNRFGIRPGFRWDGVGESSIISSRSSRNIANDLDRTAKDPDRKICFEDRFFQAQNARGRKELADQAFSMEDM